jgi:hypothetical protein
VERGRGRGIGRVDESSTVAVCKFCPVSKYFVMGARPSARPPGTRVEQLARVEEMTRIEAVTRVVLQVEEMTRVVIQVVA